MPQSPLGSDLPLSGSPYHSRVSLHYGSEDKNYYMVAFTPGYALQASELNEVQELFFLNQNLTQRMNSNWSATGYSDPFWEGLIPLQSNGCTASTPIIAPSIGTGVNNATTNVTFNAGWYLWTEYSSKLSFWIYLSSTLRRTVETTAASGVGTFYIGLDGSTNQINCCPSAECSDTQDPTLRDNSRDGSTSNSYFTCGAARLGITFGSTPEIRNAIASNFYPIFKFSINGATATVKFMDDQQVST
jgi:hypothetical protein